MPDVPAKVAWITGGSAGIGLAVAKALAGLGYCTVISARNQDLLKQAAAEVGERCAAVTCDVTDRDAVNNTCAAILEQHGTIDVLVNNAGHNSQNRKWDDLVPEEFDGVIAANVTGTFNAIHAVLPAMRAQGDGLVINVSSVAGKQVNPDGGVAYTIAKHGAHIMAQMLNQTELKNGIRATVIAPGGVVTRAHDWRPQEARSYMIQPEDVARAARFAIECPPHCMVPEIELAWCPL